eukprot:TRINITY_DN3678_c1_g1_i1.p2 TRINITY_DN3678_c1_g1~~TRINITY_DN3678_c1_g1_i1.p2  ORF type:complete len:118 (+),score=36.73 TRINITY_DN3678_c1_g1_i1:959-1312(+)
MTALHLASSSGKLEIVKLLIEKDPHQILEHDNLGWNALHHAAASGHQDVVNYLLDKEGLPESEMSEGLVGRWWSKIQQLVMGAEDVNAERLAQINKHWDTARDIFLWKEKRKRKDEL